MISGKDVPVQVDRIDIATGERKLLVEMAPMDRVGTFIFSPFSVSKDGAQYAYSYLKRLSTLFVVEPVR
jgi:hypothetical protein